MTPWFGTQIARRTIVRAIVAMPLAAGIARILPSRAQRANFDLDTLRSQIKGSVIAKNDGTYETWRRSMIWQYYKAPRTPDIIVQAETVEDVVATVKFAATNGLKLTTRCGGHSMSACFLRDDGILLDISRLDGVSIDHAAKTAVVGPGVIGSGLNKLLNEAGLAFPTAGCGTVPISGFLLGGGIGVNVRGWAGGRSVFAVDSVDIVTADGTLRKASRTENSDLFWAVQGAGPGLFGVVTSFALSCSEAPKIMLGVSYKFALADLQDVLHAVDELSPKIDANVDCAIAVVHQPGTVAADGPAPALDYTINLDFLAFAGDQHIAEKMLGSLTSHPVLQTAKMYSRGQLTLDEYYIGGEVSFPQTHFIADSFFTNDPIGCAKALEKSLPAPSVDTKFLFIHMGDQPLHDAACSATGRFYLATYHRWKDPKDQPVNRHYATEISRALKASSSGSYINEMDQEGRSEDIPSCYTPKAWAKIRMLRGKWDPFSVFQTFYGQS